MTPTVNVDLPRYDRKTLTPGIVHIGLGNFHRAHMAVYLDDLFNLGHGHDWAIIRLGHPGRLTRVVVDTHFFKGNYPDTCEILGANLPGHADSFTEAEILASESWKVILPKQKLQMDHPHEFSGDMLADIGPVTHICYAMHPDGGTMRLRLFGVKG